MNTDRDRKMKWTHFMIWGLIFLMFFTVTAFAEEPLEPPYLDLDGDGFDDNIADDDDNGIPDRFEAKPDKNLPELAGTLGNVFNTEITMAGIDAVRTHSEEFSLRQFRTRALTQRCHGFGALEDFGPGSGIGLGAMGGTGGCAGGVCAP